MFLIFYYLFPSRYMLKLVFLIIETAWLCMSTTGILFYCFLALCSVNNFLSFKILLNWHQKGENPLELAQMGITKPLRGFNY